MVSENNYTHRVRHWEGDNESGRWVLGGLRSRADAEQMAVRMMESGQTKYAHAIPDGYADDYYTYLNCGLCAFFDGEECNGKYEGREMYTDSHACSEFEPFEQKEKGDEPL
jgi:hypothetical protein